MINNFPLRLEQVISKILNVTESQISDATAPQNTPEWDSFNAMVLVAEIEKVFNIEFEFDEVSSMTSVGNIKSILRNKGVAI